MPRTCTWARLIEKDSRRLFIFIMSTWIIFPSVPRKNSVVLLTQFIHKRSSPDPFVLTGDFNAGEKSAPIKYLKGKIPLRIKKKGLVSNPDPLVDTFRVRYPDHRHVVTFHGYRRLFFRFKLDYIFVPSSVQVQDAILFIRNGKNITHPTISRCSPILIWSGISASVNSGAF